MTVEIASPHPELVPQIVYAQTNLQLFNQLQRQGYSKSELTLVHAAYELAQNLFSGYFLASGRTQIAHVVGTASILASLNLPAKAVAAGLIHNVYTTGDFGDGCRGISGSRRRLIRQAVGADTEEYVYRFPTVRRALVSRTVSLCSQTACQDNSSDLIDRQVLLIALAEQLDHRQNFEHKNAPIGHEIAEQLGFHILAVQLSAVANDPTAYKFVNDFSSRSVDRSRVIAPRSYRMRLRTLIRQQIIREKKRFGQVAHRLSLRLLS